MKVIIDKILDEYKDVHVESLEDSDIDDMPKKKIPNRQILLNIYYVGFR